MAFVYNVFVNETDPDDLGHYEYVGYRSTMRGAQSLAEKYLDRQIHGFFKRAHNTWFTGSELWKGKQAKIIYDHPWGKPNRATSKRDAKKPRKAVLRPNQRVWIAYPDSIEQAIVLERGTGDYNIRGKNDPYLVATQEGQFVMPRSFIHEDKMAASIHSAQLYREHVED